MTKLILNQLKKCKIELPEYDENTTSLLIPKADKSKVKEDLLINHYYKIEVEDYIIKPYDGFNLHDNWNQGIVPKDKIMNCEIIQLIGKMVKIEAVGVDTNNRWSGWLPRKSFRVLEEI